MKTILLFFTLMWVNFTFARECKSEIILQKACEHFKKNKHQPFVKLKDGWRYLNPLFSEENVKKQELEINETQKKRMKQIFEKAKTGLRERIMNGVDEKKLSPEKKNLLRRIEAVQLADPDERSKEVGPKCMVQPYNAFYVAQNHQVSVCDGYYQYPEEALIFILGHEISHSIDPCKSRSSLYKVSRDFIDQKVQGHESEYEHWDQYFGENEYIHLSAVGHFKNFFSDLKTVDKSDVELVGGAFSENNHPYSDVRKCLIDHKKFRDNHKTQTNIEDCSEDQINETMADVYGTWAYFDKVESYISSDSLYSLIAIAGPDVCDPKAAVSKTTLSKTDYAATHRRFKDVILQSPELRAAFGCNPEPGEICLKMATNKNSAQSSGSKRSRP